jgi:hypothetical protein
VHRVVPRILDTNDLGNLHSDPQTPTPPPRVAVQQPSLDGFGDGGPLVGQPDLWDPDTMMQHIQVPYQAGLPDLILLQ